MSRERHTLVNAFFVLFWPSDDFVCSKAGIKFKEEILEHRRSHSQTLFLFEGKGRTYISSFLKEQYNSEDYDHSLSKGVPKVFPMTVPMYERSSKHFRHTIFKNNNSKREMDQSGYEISARVTPKVAQWGGSGG